MYRSRRCSLEKLETAARETHLFSKRMKTWRDFSPVHVFKAVFFISVGVEILIAPIGVFLGWISDSVHWPRVIVDAAVFLTNVIENMDRSEKTKS
jgi:hypothetical protein